MYRPPEDKLTQIAAINAASLTLLKIKALKALFSVAILLVQKLISKNEVIPISSHPSNRANHDPDMTSSIIDHPKSLKYTRKFSMFFSNRIYENA